MDDPVSAALLADIREAAAEVGLTARTVTIAEFEEAGRRAWLRRGYRFHITASATGHPMASSWCVDEATARERFAAIAARWSSRPGARIILIDEAERTTLAAWQGEPSC